MTDFQIGFLSGMFFVYGITMLAHVYFAVIKKRKGGSQMMSKELHEVSYKVHDEEGNLIKWDTIDANLLLASEDLLRACESALEVWREYPLNPNDPSALSLAEAYLKIKRAVKKAKGGD